MNVYLLRHGETEHNRMKRYQGSLDAPLCPEGEARLCRADFSPDTVVVSPMLRARQTARLLFPEARQVVEDDLREMDFGAFEGRSARDMEEDAAYRSWVDGGCIAPCPGGEDMAGFSRRVCAVFSRLVDREMAAGGRGTLVIVAHGGVQMAVMAQYGLPVRPYFQWQSPNGGGYLLETDAVLWTRRRKLQLLGEVQYTKGEETC